MKNKVQDSVKTQRAARLEELSGRLHRAFYERYVGTEANVLWESSPKAGWMMGFTENYIKVKMPFDSSKINTTERVKLAAVDNMCEMLGEKIK
jgi:threonylcarbamoyladenosine tRNA methylthiotransferase MtaB